MNHTVFPTLCRYRESVQDGAADPALRAGGGHGRPDMQVIHMLLTTLFLYCSICSYYLDSHNLYSIKWYKGRHEFYRYMPHEDPRVRTFPVKGMNINVSTESVVLKPLLVVG